MDDLTDEQRMSSAKAAESYYELAKNFYPQDYIPQLEDAWAASLDGAVRFGYTSGPVFEILSPHHLFREPDPPPDVGASGNCWGLWPLDARFRGHEFIIGAARMTTRPRTLFDKIC